MVRMIMSEEQVEKEAKALADYKQKKIKALENTIKELEAFFNNHLNELFARLESKIQVEASKFFSTTELKKVMKDMDLIEEHKQKINPKRKKKLLSDFKTQTRKPVKQKISANKEMFKIIQEYLGEEDRGMPEIPDEVYVPNIYVPNIKEQPKKKRGRPPGSKNKSKNKSKNLQDSDWWK